MSPPLMFFAVRNSYHRQLSIRGLAFEAQSPSLATRKPEPATSLVCGVCAVSAVRGLVCAMLEFSKEESRVEARRHGHGGCTGM